MKWQHEMEQQSGRRQAATGTQLSTMPLVECDVRGVAREVRSKQALQAARCKLNSVMRCTHALHQERHKLERASLRIAADLHGGSPCFVGPQPRGGPSHHLHRVRRLIHHCHRLAASCALARRAPAAAADAAVAASCSALAALAARLLALAAAFRRLEGPPQQLQLHLQQRGRLCLRLRQPQLHIFSDANGWLACCCRRLLAALAAAALAAAAALGLAGRRACLKQPAADDLAQQALIRLRRGREVAGSDRFWSDPAR